MKFVVNKKLLTGALKAVAPAEGIRSTLPVLTGVHIEANRTGITLSGTDLQAAARHVLRDEVTVSRAGSLVVPAKPLVKAIAAAATDEITVETIESDGKPRVALTSGARTVALGAPGPSLTCTMPSIRRSPTLSRDC